MVHLEGALSFQNAVQQRRPERPGLTLEEYNQGHDYPYANILGDTRNRSRRRLNWFNWFAALTLLAAAVAAIMEAM
jgi:hypothetical protein